MFQYLELESSSGEEWWQGSGLSIFPDSLGREKAVRRLPVCSNYTCFCDDIESRVPGIKQ